MNRATPGPGGPPPPAPWQGRVDRARATILDNRPGPMVENQMVTVQRSLGEAEADRRHLLQTLGNLDQARVAADLKAALRSPDDRRSTDPTSATPHRPTSPEQ